MPENGRRRSTVVDIKAEMNKKRRTSVYMINDDVVYTQEEVIEDETYSCYQKMGWLLSTHACHYLVIFLVVLDVGFVLTEMVFDRKIRSFDDCCKDQNYMYYCPGYRDDLHHWEHASHVVHLCSITVLSMFAFEVILKIIFTPKHFFSHKMEIFDALVVFIAISLDVVYLFDHLVSRIAGLIIFVRLWRVVRIVNGIILSAKQNADKRVKKEKTQVARLEIRVHDLKQLNNDLNEYMTQLKLERSQRSSKQDDSNKSSSPPSYTTSITQNSIFKNFKSIDPAEEFDDFDSDDENVTDI